MNQFCVLSLCQGLWGLLCIHPLTQSWGKPRTRWLDVVERDLRQLGVSSEDTEASLTWLTHGDGQEGPDPYPWPLGVGAGAPSRAWNSTKGRARDSLHPAGEFWFDCLSPIITANVGIVHLQKVFIYIYILDIHLRSQICTNWIPEHFIPDCVDKLKWFLLKIALPCWPLLLQHQWW